MKRVKEVFSHITNFGKSKNFKNSYWSLLEFAIYPLLMLVATPFFIKKLGVEQLGIWMLINSIIGSLTILNGGFGDAAIKYISKYNAKNDEEGVKRVVNSTFSLFVFISFVVVLLGYFLLIIEDHFHLFSANIKQRELVFKSLYVVTLLFAFRLVEQIILSFFRGFERYDIASKFSIISKSTMLIINIVLAAMGYSLIQIFMSSTIVTVINLGFEFFWLKKFCPYITLRKKPDWATLKEISGFSLWSWLQTIAGILFSQADKFVVAMCAGISTLAYYSIGFMVANQIHALFAAASSWLFPVISKKVEQNNDLKAPYYKAQFFLISSSLLFITIIYLLRETAFMLWLGPETYANSILIIEGFLLYEALIIPSIAPYFFFNASGYIKRNTLFMLIANVFMLIMLYVGFYFYDIKGMLVGRVVGTLAVYFVWMTSFHRLLLGEKNLWGGLTLFMPAITLVAIMLIPVGLIKLALCFVLVYFLGIINKRISD